VIGTNVAAAILDVQRSMQRPFAAASALLPGGFGHALSAGFHRPADEAAKTFAPSGVR
jgi:hypothetical protein